MTTGKFTLVIRWPSGQSTICGEMTDHQHGEICRILSPDYRAQPIQGGDAVEVVAHMYQHEETGVTGFVDQQQVDWGFEKNNPRLHLCGPLMTVAQHQRILAASVGSGEPVAWRVTGRDGLTVTAQYPEWAEADCLLTITPLYTHAKLASLKGEP